MIVFAISIAVVLVGAIIVGRVSGQPFQQRRQSIVLHTVTSSRPPANVVSLDAYRHRAYRRRARTMHDAWRTEPCTARNRGPGKSPRRPMPDWAIASSAACSASR